VSKSCADLIAQSYHLTYGLPVSITRAANFYGGGDLNFNRIIPGTIRSVLNGTSPILRSDGTMIRDYIYVRDVVAAYLLLAEAMDDAKFWGQAYNFGVEMQLSVLEITKKILDVMGRADLPPIILGEAKAEIRVQYLSAARAANSAGSPGSPWRIASRKQWIGIEPICAMPRPHVPLKRRGDLANFLAFSPCRIRPTAHLYCTTPWERLESPYP
jgi:NAD dependent epimerase/dehydratase family